MSSDLFELVKENPIASGVLILWLLALIFALPGHLKLRALKKKYGDEELAKRIFKKSVWQGMTTEMLVDSLGRPVELDERIMKSKTRRVFKYNRTGKNRFQRTVTVENGIVVGWTNK